MFDSFADFRNFFDAPFLARRRSLDRTQLNFLELRAMTQAKSSFGS